MWLKILHLKETCRKIKKDYVHSFFFQAALLYTSAKGERRIRVHTLCLPTSASVSDIINSADQQAVLGMLVKFGKY